MRLFKKIFNKIRYLFFILAEFRLSRKIYSYVYLKYKGVDTQFGDVLLYGLPIIHKTIGSKIRIAKGATLVSNTKNNIAGINHPVIIATLSKDATIEIGRVGISGATICAVKRIEISDFAGLGANSKIFDTDFHCINPISRRSQRSIEEALSAPILISEDVWIGSDVTVLKGVTIGRGTVIGAGSIVTKSLPQMVVAVGNPAKIIKEIN